ncbi:MAG TPA: TetR/AcrR family transcriptional regulator [Saprospiraceae bacterium]|nr:TetR/AcrR family transcriptional regulator [Saprospiraceae bacterium]MBK8827507.1 TetR/AcrR family transcriptional regulator [Saprospiraceae bacterium]MBK9583361.1 TetR/AcrR family transcriptional regulator [Saprospiraceae bacterium]HRG41762.1 TetR/AcrR family transcriptional regulator [Saprospiraceae bacterium]
MKQALSDTEIRIIAAAERIFLLKGLDGARMQDIADEASINKAMLHYYFRNKQQLFDIILDDKISKVFDVFQVWAQPHLNFEQKLRKFVEEEINLIKSFPILPLFIMLEARKNPDLIPNKLKNFPIQDVKETFQNIIQADIDKGNIRPVKMDEIILNTMSLCVYPVIAAPIFQYAFKVDNDAYMQYLEERKQLVPDMILRDLNYKTPQN